MLGDVDFGKGIICKYIDFDVNIEIALTEQVDFLKEDILQICYESNYILDVGWYPEFNRNGSFKIVIIKDYNWENPVYESKCRDITILKEQVEKCVQLIRRQSVS